MRVLSQQISQYIESSSWIRKMFESGRELKAEFGEENVCDFSLGNPDLPPPAEIGDALHRIADSATQSLSLGYMPNAGYPEVRAKLADMLSEEQNVDLTADQVVLTCGAAGGLNALFRAVLEPGDEVVCPAPYFVEYGFYVGNYGGTLRSVKSRPMTFEMDIEAIEAAMGPKTRAVIVNSPNNPTGRIYTETELRRLASILEKHTQRTERVIYLVSDEPYRFLSYGNPVPPILPLYKHSVVIGSFSKKLSVAGERIGYAAANPNMDGVDELLNGVILTNRILGYVNAPAIGQQLLGQVLGSRVDTAVYRERRDAMARILRDAKIEFSMPQGAFYFFPKAPTGDDDKVFVDLLMQQRVLGVPGTGFGYPGFFRLAFCVDKSIIERSADGFKRAAEAARE